MAAPQDPNANRMSVGGKLLNSYTANGGQTSEGSGAGTAFAPTPVSKTGTVQGNAPAGSTKNSDGTYTSATGLVYSGAPSSDKVGRYPSGSDTATDESQLDASYQPETEAQIQSRIENGYASEIASIKSIAADSLASQGVVNDNNEGRTRAASGAAGVLGEDIGNENQAGAEGASQAANATITDKENADLSTIDSAAASAAEGEYTTEKGNQQTYLQSKITDTQAKIATISASSDLADLPQKEYDSLYATAGFDTPDEFNAYYNASRTAALQGLKLQGDSTIGYYLPVVASDGSVSYKNVIKGKPVDISGSQYGNYEYDPSTGAVTTIAPGTTSKVITSGGRLWLVPMKGGSPTGGAAVPLTPKSTGTDKVGWDKASVDQQLAVQSQIEQAAGGDTTKEQHYLQLAQTDPDVFLTTLNAALSDGSYTPATLSGTSTPQGGDSTSADDSAAAAAQSAQDAEDAADNMNDDTSGGSQ